MHMLSSPTSLLSSPQELAVDLLYHFPAASEQLLRAAAVVCLGDTYPASTALRLLDVLSAKAAAGAADSAASLRGAPICPAPPPAARARAAAARAGSRAPPRRPPTAGGSGRR